MVLIVDATNSTSANGGGGLVGSGSILCRLIHQHKRNDDGMVDRSTR